MIDRARLDFAVRTPTGMPMKTDISTATIMMAMVCIALSHRPRVPTNQSATIMPTDRSTRREAA